MQNDFNALRLGLDVIATFAKLYPEQFDYSLVSPNIGKQHRFIEYLLGATLCDEQEIENSRQNAAYFDETFASGSREYYRY